MKLTLKQYFLCMKIFYLFSGGAFMLFCINEKLYLENQMYPYVAPVLAIVALVSGIICEAMIEA